MNDDKNAVKNQNHAKKPIILDGRVLRDQGISRLKKLMGTNKKTPTLAILQVGNLTESSAYIEQKRKFAEKIGAGFIHERFPEDVSETSLVNAIIKFNQNQSVHGIIVQLPIPACLNRQRIIDAVIVSKDTDGLTSENKKLFEAGNARAVAPATARGVLSLLIGYGTVIKGKKATVIGRSALVGAPIAALLAREGASVTVCHRQTENIPEKSRQADILIVAIGRPHFITKDYVSSGQTVIDVGINSVAPGTENPNDIKKLEYEIPRRRLVGDVDFDAVKNIVGAISPVPGGVGPMTVLSLFENLVSSCPLQPDEN